MDGSASSVFVVVRKCKLEFCRSYFLCGLGPWLCRFFLFGVVVVVVSLEENAFVGLREKACLE